MTLSIGLDFIGMGAFTPSSALGSFLKLVDNSSYLLFVDGSSRLTLTA